MLQWLRSWFSAEPSFAGRDPRWPALRAKHLLIEPTCQACGSNRDLNVHHILPVGRWPSLELSPSNLITLCEGPVVNCHLLYGHVRNWGSYNPTVRQDAADWLRKIQERPK